MRKSLPGCVGMIGLIVIMGAALLGGLALGRHWQGISATSWVVRLPAPLTPEREGAMFLVSLRDACAYVSVNDFRRKLSDQLPGAPPRQNSCTPFFSKGSTRR